ncbi:unnamed protein product [Didymodactylos carnosus]|uniref:Uncharacterized protein n=1 Tax=Didymodactylos carnosus TaxID=1234261 RepID=A0A815F3J6_9BILA|nr:unnamed protein product [Didymodactylos carnosus]CAF1318214.1 unnamed protein product [Didymodactylos carnosus]CAF3953678.1 unnamed protein product [Didymodactylos carnosus]CAF4161752.1 unnamed protein product [Didymodactylos carnosus]
MSEKSTLQNHIISHGSTPTTPHNSNRKKNTSGNLLNDNSLSPKTRKIIQSSQHGEDNTLQPKQGDQQRSFLEEHNYSCQRPDNYSCFDTEEQTSPNKSILDKYLNAISTIADTTIETVFATTLPTSYSFALCPVDLLKLKNIRDRNLHKQTLKKFVKMGLPIQESSNTMYKIFKAKQRQQQQRASGEESDGKRKVDIEYLDILLPHIKKYNSCCGLCVEQRYFGKQRKLPSGYLLRCNLLCHGSPYCKFRCFIIVHNNGTRYIISRQNVVNHYINQKIARPIRGAKREELKEKFKAGGSVYRTHVDYAQTRTTFEKLSFSYDKCGTSKKTFQKIKSEAVSELILYPKVDTALQLLEKRFKKEINPDGDVQDSDLRMCVTKDGPTLTGDLFDVSDDETDNNDDDTNNEPVLHVTRQHSQNNKSTRRVKTMIDEEVELNTANSEFKTALQIFIMNVYMKKDIPRIQERELKK